MRATVAPSIVPRAGVGGTVGGSAEGRYEDGIHLPTAERVGSAQHLVPRSISRHSRVSPRNGFLRKSSRCTKLSSRNGFWRRTVHRCISERTQIVEVPMPRSGGISPRERMQQRTVDAPTLQVLEETVEVGRLVLHERVQQRTAEQAEDLPQHPEETVEMVRSVSHERVQQRAVEQAEDLPQSPEETVEVVRSVASVSRRTN